MDNLIKGHKTIKLLYDKFNDYFKSGNIVISGSFYYKKIGCELNVEYKDVDIVVDEKKDEVLHHILDTIESNYELVSSFRHDWGTGLIGSFSIEGYAGVDIFRNDFTTLLHPIEIIPGVWSYRLTDEVLFNTYEKLELYSTSNKDKYNSIKNFFKDRYETK